MDGGQMCEVDSPKSLCGSDETITGQLTRKKQRLERELNDVTQALDALQNNPELTKVLELVNKARR